MPTEIEAQIRDLIFIIEEKKENASYVFLPLLREDLFEFLFLQTNINYKLLEALPLKLCNHFSYANKWFVNKIVKMNF